MIAALSSVAPLFGAAAKKSSGSPALLIFVVIAAGFYFLIYRPQQRKAKAARAQSTTFDVGDEVLTAGGIVGHIIEIDGDRVTLETSVGASFVVLKQYVIRKLEEPVPTEPDEDGSYADDDSGDLDDHEEQAEISGGSTEAETDGGEDAEELHADETPSTEGHPSGQGGTTGSSTKPDSGDDNSGPDGPPII
jgi:preprotein translocase subunit YajC